MTEPTPSERLFQRLGIAPGYTHAGGWWVDIPAATRCRLAAAMGYPADSPRAVEESLQRLDREDWGPLLPPVRVVAEDTGRVAVDLAVPCEGRDAAVELVLEPEDGPARTWSERLDALVQSDATVLDGRALERRRLVLDGGALPCGYHALTARLAHPRREATLRLIVVPRRCHLPEDLRDGRRRPWGPQVQLYGARAAGNPGHGTFSDLARLGEGAGRLGAGLVGVNPLHALFPDQPMRRSPYAPSSRLMLNPLYIDPAATPEAGQAALPAVADGERHRLQNVGRVDYDSAAAAVWPALEALWAAFRERHLDSGDHRDRAFAAFRTEGGAVLERFACHQALAEHYGPDPWFRWPGSYRHPDNTAVADFARDNRDRVLFHQYLQFEADRQLSAAGARVAAATGLAPYLDLAVGFDRDGADAWMFQDAVPMEIAVGCPPDLRNPVGQDWGQATWSPRALADLAYAPVIALLRANMRHAGALRLDHAFQLQRLYWIPVGATPTEGGYAAYPLDDLMGLVALESRRNGCIVVAEDLGTIPEGFRERLMGTDALSFRVLHRERGEGRSYNPPESYPPLAAVTAGTHDQGTLAGFWTGRDVATRKALDLYPTPADGARAEETRATDRARLLDALAAAGLAVSVPEEADGLPSLELATAVHRFLARTPSRLLLVNLEDMTNRLDQVNMPATVNAHPNWLRRLPVTVEELDSHPRIRAVAAAINAERG